MSKNAMPKSKAKTAYGLLSEIRKLILEEPKRYDQQDMLITGVHNIRQKYGENFVPSCGTVGCVAGWVSALKFPRKHGVGVLDLASKTLGLNGSFDECIGQSFELFDSEAAGERCELNGETTPESLQAHAQRGAEHIAKFQKKYATQLKAKRV